MKPPLQVAALCTPTEHHGCVHIPEPWYPPKHPATWRRYIHHRWLQQEGQSSAATLPFREDFLGTIKWLYFIWLKATREDSNTLLHLLSDDVNLRFLTNLNFLVMKHPTVDTNAWIFSLFIARLVVHNWFSAGLTYLTPEVSRVCNESSWEVKRSSLNQEGQRTRLLGCVFIVFTGQVIVRQWMYFELNFIVCDPLQSHYKSMFW